MALEAQRASVAPSLEGGYLNEMSSSATLLALNVLRTHGFVPLLRF